MTVSADALRIHSQKRQMQPDRLRERYASGKWRGDELAYVRVSHETTRVLVGLENLEEWDDEEIQHGRRRSSKGDFRGPDPVILPREIHDELVRRTISKAQKLMTENLEAAVKVLTELATTDGVDARDRIKAIDMIMNRVMGKEPVRVEVEPKAKWQMAIEGGIQSMAALEEDMSEQSKKGKRAISTSKKLQEAAED